MLYTVGLISEYKDQLTLLVAVAALLYTSFQFKVQKQHNKLSVLPHLDSLTDVDGENRSFALEITNNGIGPAVVTHIELFYKGNLIQGKDPVAQVIEMIVSDMPGKISGWGHHRMAIGSFISPGEIIKLIDLNFYLDAGPDMNFEFEEYLTKNAELKIWYRSVYGQEFLFTANNPLSSLEPLCRIKWFRNSNAKHHSV